MKLSSIGSFLPFNPTPAKNYLQSISRIALTTGGAALASWRTTSDPALICAWSALGAVASIASEKVREGKLISDFLKSEHPSANLMFQIVDSPGAVDSLIQKIKSHPEILTKKSESGKTLLQHFVERRKLLEDIDDSCWDTYLAKAAFYCKDESDKTALLQYVQERKILQNTDPAEPFVSSNTERLKRLLFSGPWEKESFLNSLRLIHEKTVAPDYWFKGQLQPCLLPSWSEPLYLALSQRKDFSEDEKMTVHCRYTMVLK